MTSQTNTIHSNTPMPSGGEFKITFYSTSPKEESKSKYPMQTRTSYTVPDNGGGDTEINFGKSLGANVRPKTRITGFRPEGRKQRDDPVTKKRKTSDPHSPLVDTSPDASSDVVKSRSGRVCKKPQRYEPVETVTDDFDDNDYDSDDSSEN